MRIQKILLPHDFSEHCEPAVEYACDLAKKYKAQVTVLHVYQLPGMAFPEGYVVAGPETVQKMLSQVEAALQKAKAEVEAKGVDAVEAKTAQGVPFSEIVRTAREEDFDLIVMGTHGRTGLKHALLGSVAEKVVRKAPCAVLTVRPSDMEFEMP